MGLFGGGESSGDVDALRREVEALKSRVHRLERMVEHYTGGEPVAGPISPAGYPVSEEVLRLARQGNKIGAIKLLREESGMGLKESKDVVDSLD